MPLSPDDSELIDTFIAYRINYDKIAPNTVRMYTIWLTRLGQFANERGHTLLTVPRMMFLDFKESLGDKRNATVRAYFACFRSFYKWASGPAIMLVEENPVPKIRLDPAAKLPSMIPTAKDIFSMRCSPKVDSATKAAVFELLLSSGMRVCELSQLRCCDLNFSIEIVEDVEFGIKSPFVGGTVMLSQKHGFRIKRGKSRRIFFSRLAAKMLQCHMANHGLCVTSAFPLFPYATGTYNTWINEIGAEVLARATPITYRDPLMRDVVSFGESIKGVSKRYMQSLKAAKERHESIEAEFPGIAKSVKPEVARKFTIHPHCFRHFYAMLMYFRNWQGNYADTVAMSQLLGHSSINQSSEYMQLEPACRNFREWKQVMMGNGAEYRMLYQ